ncbi:MAG: TonB family protein [Myxococcota bacterium]
MIARHSQAGLRPFLAASAVVHVAVVVLAAMFAGTGRAMEAPPEAVEVKLTRLGKARPKDFLPRKESAPPPPQKVAPKPVETPDPPSSAPKVKAPETAKERVKNMNRVSNALERLKNMDDPEGDESGSEFGNTGELVDATDRARFVAELRACLQSHFVLEGIATKETAGRIAHVNVSVRQSGEVRFLGLEKSSGDERVDRQIINAARRCKKVGKAPQSIGNSWASGVLVKFRPDAG